MDRIARAIEIMREERVERLSVQELAADVGLSPIVLSRLFTAAQGVGPLAYMRRLRLERAAEQIASNPGLPLVEVAFDAGFDSQQTFTRAFTAMFRMPPGQFRKTVPARRPTMPSKSHIEPEFSNHTVVSLPSRRFAGRRVAIDGTNGVTPGTAWERMSYPIPGQVKGMSYGVCFGETPGGITEYMACAELQAGTTAPDGFDALDLPAERYFVVRQKMPAAGFGDHLKAGLERLWSGLMSEAGVEPSGSPDLEAYPDDLIAGQTEGWLTHMVPIKG